MRRLNLKAQAISEYLVVVVAFVVVFLLAAVYYQRSLQGKYRQTGDAIGGGEQYQP